jgi:5-methylcytosine-specific restriction endonuclease McrA
LRKHTKVYLSYFNFDTTDFIPCEVCNSQAVDIHHIKARGMGGSKDADNISNLMALCRNCHLEYGDKKQHLDFLIKIHADKVSPN